MKRILGGVAVLALLLAGCGSSQVPAAQTATATVTETVERSGAKQQAKVTVTALSTVTVTALPTVTVTAVVPQQSDPVESAPITGQAGAGEVGQAVQFPWFDGAIGTLTIHSLQWADEGKGDSFFNPEQAWLIADVTYEGVKGTISANPGWLEVVDSQGRRINGLIGDSGNNPVLSSPELGPGKKARGFVSFDIDPAETWTLLLQEPLGSTLAEWTVPAK